MSERTEMADREEEDLRDAEEGLSLLLGGLTAAEFPDASTSIDKDCSAAERPHVETNAAEKRNGLRDSHDEESSSEKPHPTAFSDAAPATTVDADGLFSSCFENAYCVDRDGRLCRPPVRIVDKSHQGRGYGLVATRALQRGQLIFTQRAAEAAQVPTFCAICTQRPSEDSPRACQECFRSLAPASSCLGTDSPTDASFPLAHLWPVGEDETTESPEERLYRDVRSDRVQCKKCHSNFCSMSCWEHHVERMGSCCLCRSVLNVMLHETACLPPNDEDDQEQQPNSDTPWEVQPPLVLAARMFCAAVQRSRARHDTPHGVSDPYEGMCGTASDLRPLEMGLATRQHETAAETFSVREPFQAACKVLSFIPEDGDFENFQRLIAVAARNGFFLQTQSPFSQYYNAMLRHVGGRGTPRHAQTMQQLAKVLGSSDGNLSRDMDREMNHRCTVGCIAIFPLVARANHSCDPNAQVRGGEYVDCIMDVVALRNVAVGEEITICYIGKPRGNANRDRLRRQRELRARYLFECSCRLCTDGQET